MAGWLLQRVTLGPTDATARARVERDVRRSFDAMTQELRASTDAVADPALVRQAAEAEAPEAEAAAVRLFSAARASIEAIADGEAALTVLAAEGMPLAWAGRPSELPPDRLDGGESYAFSSTPLGPRLVYIRPVGSGADRAGTVVAERSLIPPDRRAVGGSLRSQGRSEEAIVPTLLAAVSIRPASASNSDPAGADSFQIAAPGGEPLVTATIASGDLRATRDRWRRATWSLSLLTFAIALVLVAGPLLDWRNRTRRGADFARSTLLAAAIVVIARLLARMASPADWSEISVFSSSDYAGTLLPPLLTSPFDFLLTALAAGALVGLLLLAVEAWRVAGWKARRSLARGQARAGYIVVQLLAGTGLAAVLVGHQELLRNTIANTTLDLLHLSLSDWDASRIALQFGLVLTHATTVGLAVAILRAALARWSVPRGHWQLRAATVACWLGPVVAWRLAVERGLNAQLPILTSAVVVTLLALNGTRLAARFRHGSQAFRLTLLTLALIAPAFAFYPTLFQLAWRAKSQFVETRYAPQALKQRRDVQTLLEMSLEQIDRLPNLRTLVAQRPDSATAIEVWQATPLADYPVTSSVELFDATGQLVSRYAFNLPEELVETPRSEESSCNWLLIYVTKPFLA